jgi:uncharacterized membrane protein
LGNGCASSMLDHAVPPEPTDTEGQHLLDRATSDLAPFTRLGLPALLGLVTLLAILALWPDHLLDQADHAAYAVCHRIPDRTYWIGGRPLPLCARCSGTYLGALAGLTVLLVRGRGRAGMLPSGRYLLLSALFVAAWAVDGLNSYLTLFPGMPHLYEPRNPLRLGTGALEGLVIAMFLLPVANLSLWRDDARLGAQGPINADGVPPADLPVIAGGRDMAWMLAGAAVPVLLIISESPILLYPLAVLSGLMVIALIAAVNTILLLTLSGKAGRAVRWGQLATPLVAGVMLAVLELTAIATLRAELTAAFGLPW